MAIWTPSGAAISSAPDATPPAPQRAGVQTPLGTIVLEASPRGLTQIDLLHSAEEEDRIVPTLATPPQGSILAEAVRQLEEYFAGERQVFDLPFDNECGEFEQAVVDALVSKVPYGTTVSYGQLADAAGYPGAARAVGSVMRRNQFMIVIPCHRVIGADGSMRGYGGAGCGFDNKRWLLEFESSCL